MHERKLMIILANFHNIRKYRQSTYSPQSSNAHTNFIIKMTATFKKTSTQLLFIVTLLLFCMTTHSLINTLPGLYIGISAFTKTGCK